MTTENTTATNTHSSAQAERYPGCDSSCYEDRPKLPGLRPSQTSPPVFPSTKCSREIWGAGGGRVTGYRGQVLVYSGDQGALQSPDDGCLVQQQQRRPRVGRSAAGMRAAGRLVRLGREGTPVSGDLEWRWGSRGRDRGLWSQPAPFTVTASSCVPWVKLLDFSLHQCPHLLNGANTRT